MLFIVASRYVTLLSHIIYPPGSKCEALRLGVHLILLYFIRILVVGTEIIFYLVGVGVGVDVDGGLFLSLNLLIIIWYISFPLGVSAKPYG